MVDLPCECEKPQEVNWHRLRGGGPVPRGRNEVTVMEEAGSAGELLEGRAGRPSATQRQRRAFASKQQPSYPTAQTVHPKSREVPTLHCDSAER